MPGGLAAVLAAGQCGLLALLAPGNRGIRPAVADVLARVRVRHPAQALTLSFNPGWLSVLTRHGRRMMIFGFPTTELEDQGGGRGVQYRVAGGRSRAAAGRCPARDRLTVFRRELYRCFTARADALFEVLTRCCAPRGR